jgi:hypothetical protein
MGEVPIWYRVVKAAQYLGTPPWELESRPWRYILQVEEALEAEAWAASQTNK